MRLDGWQPAQAVNVEMGFSDGTQMRLWTCESVYRGPDDEKIYLAYGPVGQCLPPGMAWMKVSPPGTRVVVAVRPGLCGHARFLTAEQTMS